MRQRVFFIANKMQKPVRLNFNERQIKFKDISDNSDTSDRLTERYIDYWDGAAFGQSVGKFAQKKKINPHRPTNTIVANGRHFHPKYKRELNDREIMLAGSWPLDYDFQDIEVNYLVGMSVPPVMMAQVSHQVYKQLLSTPALTNKTA